MDETDSAFGWFMAYLFCAVLLLGALAWSMLAWWQRKQRRERREAKKAANDQFRAWRDGKKPPLE